MAIIGFRSWNEYNTIARASKPAGAGLLELEGVILAGGASRRMGGRDKALLVLGGRTLLERVHEALRPIAGRIRVVGRTAAPDIEGTPLEAVPDLLPGLGPLSGIFTALRTATAGSVLVVACDLPFVTAAFLRGLSERLSPEVEAVAPRPPSGPVPVCAVYRVGCAEKALARLQRGELSARGFLDSLRARFVEGAELSELDPGGRCLLNVNTPEELDSATGGS